MVEPLFPTDPANKIILLQRKANQPKKLGFKGQILHNKFNKF